MLLVVCINQKISIDYYIKQLVTLFILIIHSPLTRCAADTTASMNTDIYQ